MKSAAQRGLVIALLLALALTMLEVRFDCAAPAALPASLLIMGPLFFFFASFLAAP
jgi:hypothetical protein